MVTAFQKEIFERCEDIDKKEHRIRYEKEISENFKSKIADTHAY